MGKGRDHDKACWSGGSARGISWPFVETVKYINYIKEELTDFVSLPEAQNQGLRFARLGSLSSTIATWENQILKKIRSQLHDYLGENIMIGQCWYCYSLISSWYSDPLSVLVWWVWYVWPKKIMCFFWGTWFLLSA